MRAVDVGADINGRDGNHEIVDRSANDSIRVGTVVRTKRNAGEEGDARGEVSVLLVGTSASARSSGLRISNPVGTETLDNQGLTVSGNILNVAEVQDVQVKSGNDVVIVEVEESGLG